MATIRPAVVLYASGHTGIYDRFNYATLKSPEDIDGFLEELEEYLNDTFEFLNEKEGE